MYQCLTFKSNFKILNKKKKHKLNTDRMRDIRTYLTMMQVATGFECRQNNAKNDNVVLNKVQMYNVY